ncbi:Putative cation/proton antiporter YbaL [Alphaproteobacteria bacterium SO-S41]|nr:Putative cation/proton antiporter YbaL [Alphaproteobacteria bacterium SO-S41]
MHDANLIATIAIGFVLAFVLGYLAVRLRLPPLVGYLVAGIVAGPFTPGFVADVGLAGQLAEVGVILLMFGVGLHFSSADLLAVKSIAIPGAVGQIVLATLMGMGLAHLWGWPLGQGLVFGLSLSVASTVVLIKALEERSLIETPQGRVAVGWLIVEDLAMVLALVLLPALAETLGGHTLGSDGHGAAVAAGGGDIFVNLAVTLGKVAAFTAIAMLIGPRVVPALLAQVARTGSRELFTLSVLAIAIGIAYGAAEVFGVSFALGAFFAGVVLSESRFSHRAAQESLPLQDAFSVLFFVSVGMLFDPTILVREPLKVLAVVALIVVGKGVIAYGVVAALRYPAGLGLLVSASLAQVGEFSFILAGLGIGLGLLTGEGRDLILAGSLLSIVLNPLVFHAVAVAQKRWMVLDIGGSAFGAERYGALSLNLAKIRQKTEERKRVTKAKLDHLLETFPMLATLGEEQQQDLLALFRPKTAEPGEQIIKRGDRADGVYLISSGMVEVHAGKVTVRLAEGAFFGEMALLNGTRRTADVTALDYAELLFLARADFLQFLQRHPDVRAAVARMADERREMNRAGVAAEVTD